MPTTSLPGAEERARFGQRLRAAREDAGLTQAQLAARCGVGANVVSTWENGHRTPKGRVPWLMCRALGYERWLGLWGDMSVTPLEGGRLYSEAEVEERAVRIAQEALSRLANDLGSPDRTT